MSWEKVSSLVGQWAPLIGTALGGPAGAGIGALIANSLDCKPTPQAIEQAIHNDPDALLKIKQLESDERVSIRAVALQTLQASLTDTQHAREQHREHWMPAALTLLLALMVLMYGAAMLWLVVPTAQNDNFVFIGGQLVMAFLTAVAYWIGSSRSSHDKSKLIGRR